jgi:hypothetical protein
VGGRGRLHLAGKLIAPIHSGAINGWWTLDDLQVTPDVITGRYRLNGMNSPKVAIDRRTRLIHIDGVEHLRRECEPGDRADAPRRFWFAGTTPAWNLHWAG